MNNKKLSDIVEKLDIKVPIGRFLFNIILDQGFSGALPEQDTQRHNHSSYEVHFITGGSGTLHILNKDIDLIPGNYYLIGPAVYHAISISPDNPVKKFHMKFRYDKIRDPSYNLVFSDIDTKIIDDAFSGMSFFSSPDIFNSIPLLKMIYNELENRYKCYYTKIQGCFTLVISDIVRAISPETEQNQKIPLKVKDELRSNIIERFFDDYYSNLTMDDLANSLNLSKSQLNRILKKLYNTTFKQKLLDTRIEVAKDLLKHSDISIENISGEVGYISLRNFQDIFKKKVGLSASMYRKYFSKHSENN